MADGDVVMWATVLGLLVGIVWSLRYIAIIDRKLDRVLKRVEGDTERGIALETKQLSAEQRQTALLQSIMRGVKVTKPRKTKARKLTSKTKKRVFRKPAKRRTAAKRATVRRKAVTRKRKTTARRKTRTTRRR